MPFKCICVGMYPGKFLTLATYLLVLHVAYVLYLLGSTMYSKALSKCSVPSLLFLSSSPPLFLSPFFFFLV